MPRGVDPPSQDEPTQDDFDQLADMIKSQISTMTAGETNPWFGRLAVELGADIETDELWDLFEPFGDVSTFTYIVKTLNFVHIILFAKLLHGFTLTMAVYLYLELSILNLFMLFVCICRTFH